MALIDIDRHVLVKITKSMRIINKRLKSMNVSHKIMCVEKEHIEKDFRMISYQVHLIKQYHEDMVKEIKKVDTQNGTEKLEEKQ